MPPPPPPGRGSLPNLPAQAAPPPSAQVSGTQKLPSVPPVPPPASTRPGAGVRSSQTPEAAASQPAIHAKNGAKLDMDWDDDQEATQVFDKEKSNADASAQSLIAPDAPEPERASMDAIMSSPPARNSSEMPAAAPVSAPAPAPTSVGSATLSGAFGALGQPRTNGASAPSARFPSGPPTTQSARSAPPPPPTSQRQPASLPPPPPPGQVTTAPMHMPLQPQQAPVPAHADTMQSVQSPMAQIPPHAAMSPVHAAMSPAHGSVPPHAAVPSSPPLPHLPPVSRAMEATHMVARVQPSRTPLIIAVLLAVMALAGVTAYLLMPRTGTLVVNVADSKGGAVQNLEVVVDGTKRCDSAPCIIREISAGVHEVKVSAKGYDPLAARAVTVDSRRDITSDFQLSAAKAAAGTGFKVTASHSGVKLSVDGKDVGPLPQEMRDLEPGEHKLRFAGDRYAPLEKTISVAKDEIVDLGNINLKVLKGKATIQLGTPGAKAYLVNGTNRKEVPQFPMAIEFDPNEKWELQGTKDGFDDYRERINFDDGQAEKTFTVTLSPKGSAAAAAPRAPAPPVAFAPPVAKEPAPPTAKAAAKEPTAAPEPAKEAKKDAPAAAAGDTALKINSLPASSIVLDGKPIGVTPQLHVPVTPGTHTILFVNSEQSLKKTISVEVKAGETKAAFAKLRE